MQLEDSVKFADNAEPRCPCVLLLDTSSSMSGDRINELNKGLQMFKDSLIQDPTASKRVEVAIVTFSSSVSVVQNFVTANQFQPPTLSASGSTHMGSGIQEALTLAAAEKAKYKEAGIAYYRPWVFMITDGKPEGESESVVQQAAQRVKEEDSEARKAVAFFAVGVAGADMERLKEICVRSPVKLDGLNFGQMFLWLSASMQRVSQSNPGEQVGLPALGWGTVS
ncbi:MAG TPA: VWA domain-containing protein [Abditibacteriaceae bacterium]|jgi:uncharacterized protein YegL